MMFIPAPRKVNYTQAKANCPATLLSFMQKTMQELVTRNNKDETLWHVPYISNNLPTNQGSPQKPQCNMCLHIYRKQWKTGSYTSAFLDTEGASDSTDNEGCRMVWAWRHTLAMDWLHAGWQKNYSHTHRGNTREGGIAQGLSAEGHFITP